MERPSDFFIFNFSKSPTQNLCFVYSPDPSKFIKSLDSIVLAVYSGPDIPDVIVLISAGKSGSNIVDKIKNDSDQAALDRIGGKASLFFASIDIASGKIDCQPISQSKDRSPSIEKLLKGMGWAKEGLSSIFGEEEVILVAPPGYTYHKPSGESSTFFLKPDLALSSSPISSFVALSIAIRFFFTKKQKISDTKTIFVDTMAISSVAYALRDILSTSGGPPGITISSFHSYGGFDEVKRPMRGTSICLISASSSMSLHDKWISDKGVSDEDVVTLITLSMAKRADRALYALPGKNISQTKEPAKVSIRISGESFLPAQEPHKKVLIRAEPFLKDLPVNSAFNLAGSNVIDIFRIDKSRPGKHRAIYIDGVKLTQVIEFIQWLDGIVRHFARATTKKIIYQGDESSRAMAELIRNTFGELSDSTIDLVGEREIDAESICRKSAIIVCAAVVGKGSRLLQISRALRDIHEGPRLYTIGYQVAESASEVATLKSNIRYSEPHFYDFECYGSIATGTQLLSSFVQEASDINLWPKAEPTPLPRIHQRIEKIRQGKPLGSDTLLPSGAKHQDSMSIRKGFAFWPDGYTPSSLQPELIFTIAAILQRSREDSKLSERDQLSSRTFRQVLLAPENFSRYNDGIIQSAIIRCSHPSELDYSSDHAASDFMKHLIIRSIESSDSDSGESSLEFVLALYFGRIKLVSTHFLEIKSLILSSTHQHDPAKAMRWIMDTENRKGNIAEDL
ncbi:hypothetical protein U4I37_15390 [Stenotrophomonas maltophilia]|uniref:hypothetical protein n=1 Tax=Stenotrophomonas maltophilia TaxID=40324 RepID=UPI0013111680|nr:hypothetical protein [Stenotrophomonas maltophilia]MDZ5787624.1 hypothetical protein [Stenotrophomonas maltophilia]HDS1553695.1 hypothetical protein [Stenotrophomonas maltophilia]